MRNKGNMTQMDLYKVSEELKDRFNFYFDKQPDIRLSRTAIDEACPLTAKVINNYNKRVEENGVQDGIMYLIDTMAFYCMLCSDMSDTNKELLEHLKELSERLDDN